MNDIALRTFIAPFTRYFERENVSEICLNQPGEVWVEEGSTFYCDLRPDLSLPFLSQLANLIAEYNHREINRELPLLSATLPNGFRVQIVMEPACERGSFVCAIRKPSIASIELRDYFKQGVFDSGEDNQTLSYAYRQKDYEKFLMHAVKLKKNIVISGGTSTGKTTFLNTLLKFLPLHERLVTIETDREVFSNHLNAVHLLAVDSGSLTDVTMSDLLKAALRLRPDRILVSELRSKEAYAYLRAVNSGHPGSITTLHADSVAGCFHQLALMVMEAGSLLSKENIITYAQSIIDVVVQIKRTEKGERVVDEVYYKDC